MTYIVLKAPLNSNQPTFINGWSLSIMCMHVRQEQQLSPRDPLDALYQLTCRPTVVQITQTHHVSDWGLLLAVATLYSPTCIVLYTHRCTRHNNRTVSMRCHACHQQTSIQPILLMSTGPWLWSTNVHYHQCWWRHVLLRQHTTMDANHRGGWT